MNVYRTPGVYIEERSIIPPSVAAVATPPILLFSQDLSIERRLADLETKIEPSWDAPRSLEGASHGTTVKPTDSGRGE